MLNFIIKVKFFYFILLLIVPLFPSTIYALSYRYIVAGLAYSELRKMDVNLSGFIEIKSSIVGENYIESILSQNKKSFQLSYDVIDSYLSTDLNTEFSKGTGTIDISFKKENPNSWCNLSTWGFGAIQTSLCQGDVIFEGNGMALNITEYDVLPSQMVLKFGMIFNKYFPIELTLTKTVTPVPEPSSFLLVIVGLMLFICKGKALEHSKKKLIGYYY